MLVRSDSGDRGTLSNTMAVPSPYARTLTLLGIWGIFAGICFAADKLITLPAGLALSSGLTVFFLFGMIAGILAAAQLFTLFTILFFRQTNKPVVEGVMVSRLYSLVGFCAIAVTLAYGLGKLNDFTGFFATFGGMLLGFSLQAPVSGFAAFVLVSLKRPFRPGDRVQFPSLGLTGDVKEMGIMYTVLDQVGGTISSEEAVGRNILIPNAMLFSQVAINYTVRQEQSYILDEVVVRITFNSNWETAEKILIDAARLTTAEIIENTGMQPYIRSELYDYGVYLRLRYQTSVKDRAEISYKISKQIFEQIQCTPTVDLAIPFVYSARAGARSTPDQKEDVLLQDREVKELQDVEISKIHCSMRTPDSDVIDQLAQSIATHGLLQPILVIRAPSGGFDIVAGQLRFEACKRLGWKTIPAVVRGPIQEARLTMEHLDRSSSGM
jgi:small-conductance mechanosensitive channel